MHDIVDTYIGVKLVRIILYIRPVWMDQVVI